MNLPVVTREDIARVVRDWGNGRIPTEEVLRWAGEVCLSKPCECQDWDEDRLVTCEVLARLDMLDLNLGLPEDAPIYLDFLSSSSGQFDAALMEFERRLDGIAYQERRDRLKDVPLYARFCACARSP